MSKIVHLELLIITSCLVTCQDIYFDYRTALRTVYSVFSRFFETYLFRNCKKSLDLYLFYFDFLLENAENLCFICCA